MKIRLKMTLSGDLTLKRKAVHLVGDMLEDEIRFLNDRSYHQMTDCEDAQKAFVQKNINLINDWAFIANRAFIESCVNQKNVYSNLFKIFNRQKSEDIKAISPESFKWLLLKQYADKFSEIDFTDDEKLIITHHNIENVLKILAKGIDVAWLKKQAKDENNKILQMYIINMLKKICHGFVLGREMQTSREKQIERFLAVLNQACKEDMPKKYGSERCRQDKLEKQTTSIFTYFEWNDVLLIATIAGEKTWFELNETEFQKIYDDVDGREQLIKGLCKDSFYELLLSQTKKRNQHVK